MGTSTRTHSSSVISTAVGKKSLTTSLSFRGFHSQHPIISRSHFWELFNKIFDLLENEHVPVATISKDYRQEVFTLNMCFALASVTLYAKDQHDKHPFGYFMAALLAFSPKGFGFDTIQDIENFLLIARFGIFHFIGIVNPALKFFYLLKTARLLGMGALPNLHQDLPRTENAEETYKAFTSLT